MIEPHWVPALLGAFGMLINAVWTVVNMSISAKLIKQIADLKEWMAHEYVSDKICRARHGADMPAHESAGRE